MQLGEIEASPEQLAVGMLVALGIVVIVRDLLRMSDVLRMADEHREDPNKLAAEALDYLQQHPEVQPREDEEEEHDGP